MNKNIEYFRIAEGKYQEEGKTVVLKGLTGYNLEREYNKKTGYGKPIEPEKFIGVFEVATKHPDKIKITKLKNQNNNKINTYQIVLKDKGEKDIAIIKVTPEVAKKHPEYVTRMDNIRAANITYRRARNNKKKINKIKDYTKKGLIGITLIGTITGTILIINKGLEKDAEIYNIKQEQFIHEQQKKQQEELDKLCSEEHAYNTDERCIERKDDQEETYEQDNYTKQKRLHSTR